LYQKLTPRFFREETPGYQRGPPWRDEAKAVFLKQGVVQLYLDPVEAI